MGKVKYREIGFDSIEDFLKWYPMHEKSFGTKPLPNQATEIVDKILNVKQMPSAEEYLKKWTAKKKRGRKLGSYKVSDSQILSVLKRIRRRRSLTNLNKQLGISNGYSNNRIKHIAASHGLTDKIKGYSTKKRRYLSVKIKGGKQ